MFLGPAVLALLVVDCHRCFLQLCCDALLLTVCAGAGVIVNAKPCFWATKTAFFLLVLSIVTGGRTTDTRTHSIVRVDRGGRCDRIREEWIIAKMSTFGCGGRTFLLIISVVEQGDEGNVREGTGEG